MIYFPKNLPLINYIIRLFQAFMKTTYLLIFSTLLSFVALAQGSNPEVISASGNSIQNNSFQLDWTLGEVTITTIENNTSQITQGFHQPYFEITSTNEIPSEYGNIEIFPNPTFDWINTVSYTHLTLPTICSV